MNGGTFLLLAAGAAAAWYFGGVEDVEDTVTQTVEVDAYNRWDDKLKESASRFGVPDYGALADPDGNALLTGGPGWWLMKAILWVESNLGRAPSVALGLDNPSDIDNSISSDGQSWGLFQVTLGTAGDFRPGTTAQDLNNPDVSIELGARIIARNALHFPGNLEYIVRSYNGGLGFLQTRLGLQDTPKYWQKVLSKLEKIEANGG